MVGQTVRAAWMMGLFGLSLLGGKLAASEPAKAAPRPAFDLSLNELASDEDTLGYYSLRVSDLSGIQGLGEVAALAAEAIGFKLSVPISDVDEISGQVLASFNPPTDDSKHGSLMMALSFSVIRLKRDMEWPRELEKMFGKAEAHRKLGQAYYRIAVPPKVRAVLGKEAFYAYPLDARVIMFTLSEETIEKIAKARMKGLSKPRWQAQSRPFEDGTMMMVFPDSPRRRQLIADLLDQKEIAPDQKAARDSLKAMLSKTETAIIAMNTRGGFELQLSMKTKQADSKEVAAQLNRLVKMMHETPTSPASGEKPGAADAASDRFGAELLKNLRVKESVDGASAKTNSKEGAEAVWKSLLRELSKLLGDGRG